ncbi:MAG: hypothetical protein R3A52_25940 [Polyangiales bacterium]
MTKRTVALTVVALALAAGCAKGVSPVGDEDAAIEGEGDDRYSFVDTGTEPKTGPDADDPWTWDDAGFDAGQTPVDTGPTILDTGPTVIDTGVRDTGVRVDAGPCGRPGYPCCAGGMCGPGMCVSDLCAETPVRDVRSVVLRHLAACGPVAHGALHGHHLVRRERAVVLHERDGLPRGADLPRRALPALRQPGAGVLRRGAAVQRGAVVRLGAVPVLS